MWEVFEVMGLRARAEIAELIVARLAAQKDRLASEYRRMAVPHFVLDNLLPEDLAMDIALAFPATSQMTLKSSLRELKYVTAQMNRCNPLLEEAIFAFHDERVVTLIAELTGLQQVEPDRLLYAGGISVMSEGHFLNPHLDNSHDKTRQRYRVLNLLYYASPGWQPQSGGGLELWPDGPKGAQITIPNLFNRLVVMATNRRSWHSVARVRSEAPRCCLSNYYFSAVSPEVEDYFHVTSFRGRPEQPVRDIVLRADIGLRMLLRKLRPTGIVENKHFYRGS
jgi:Rps23 Pro-64 3,4-dihydroxylase Tpa1-like proline 4-hydroxylase